MDLRNKEEVASMPMPTVSMFQIKTMREFCVNTHVLTPRHGLTPKRIGGGGAQS
jgi:hypothetical protein